MEKNCTKGKLGSHLSLVEKAKLLPSQISMVIHRKDMAYIMSIDKNFCLARPAIHTNLV